jgi:hypothetical protein
MLDLVQSVRPGGRASDQRRFARADEAGRRVQPPAGPGRAPRAGFDHSAAICMPPRRIRHYDRRRIGSVCPGTMSLMRFVQEGPWRPLRLRPAPWGLRGRADRPTSQYARGIAMEVLERLPLRAAAETMHRRGPAERLRRSVWCPRLILEPTSNGSIGAATSL